MQGGRQPGPDHPITVEPSRERIVVRAGGAILAETTNALVLQEASYPPVLYIPRGDVALDELTPSDTRTHCPYKGDASYFTVPGGRKDVAWSYEDPFDQVAEIKGHLAFYPDRVDAIERRPRD
jgi:uncharacterized protein (DUF427 family)